MLIGVYYAFIKKQTTNEELLVGGRQMAIFPSALSLLATVGHLSENLMETRTLPDLKISSARQTPFF
jgi:hypothetical protein